MLRFRSRPADEDDQEAAQAAWQIEHHADRHDLTIEQGRRFREHNLATNAGLDASHVAFARWLVEHRMVTP